VFKYLRYSNLKICIDLSPFAWGFKYSAHHDSGFHLIYMRILFLSLTVIFDNGTDYVFMGLTSDLEDNKINKVDAVANERKTSYR